jgi:NAD(P)-dependent dehydrogenase (short-subunit alcohol dehydrogenase family)
MPEVNPMTTALVTGAASGIGRHIAATFASRGARVAALDINEDGLASLANRHPHITPHVCDVADENAVRDTVRLALADDAPLETVVHCAGVAPLGRILDQPTPDIERAIRVNYLGTVHLAKTTVPVMAEYHRGTLIVIASIAGWIPLTSIGAYSASKAAVVSFCEVIAAECRHNGIRVVCVCLAAVETPMLQTLRRTHPETINDKPGIPPDEVLAAAESALRKGRLLAFPGRGTTTLWRARRLAPTKLTGLLEAIVKRQNNPHPHPPNGEHRHGHPGHHLP